MSHSLLALPMSTWVAMSRACAALPPACPGSITTTFPAADSVPTTDPVPVAAPAAGAGAGGVPGFEQRVDPDSETLRFSPWYHIALSSNGYIGLGQLEVVPSTTFVSTRYLPPFLTTIGIRDYDGAPTIRRN